MLAHSAELLHNINLADAFMRSGFRQIYSAFAHDVGFSVLLKDTVNIVDGSHAVNPTTEATDIWHNT